MHPGRFVFTYLRVKRCADTRASVDDFDANRANMVIDRHSKRVQQQQQQQQTNKRTNERREKRWYVFMAALPTRRRWRSFEVPG